MGSEYQSSTPDPNRKAERYPTQRSFHTSDEDTQPRLVAQSPFKASEQFEEPAYREHISGHLNPYPPGAPSFYPPDLPEQQAQRYANEQSRQVDQPAANRAQPYPQPGQQYPGQGYQQPGTYQAPNGWPPNNQAYYGYPVYAAYNAYAPYYYQYPYYQYNWQPTKPKRDMYLFVMSIVATVCSGLVLATGLLCAVILLFVAIVEPGSSAANAKMASQLFGGIVLFGALTLAGLVGGSFSLYHSIRSLMRRRSREFKMPWFWIFLGLYIILLAAGLGMRGSNLVVTNTGLSIALIGLAGLLPALTILALGVRRIHFPRAAKWPTTWRRVAVALVSGATSAILFAMIFELLLGFIVQAGLHVTSFNLGDPNAPIPNNARALLYMFLLVSVIAPLVEESVKPLAVIAIIGRINSAAEAFILGLACGIGFDLIETSGYISMGYRNWVDVAIERSSAGLLHGFGAAMVALGWYFLTHKKSLAHRRILIGLGCILYAILQHAIWNGSFVFQLLPAPIGPYLDQGKIMLGNYPMSASLLIYLVETILMLTFFLYITGKLSGRRRTTKTSPSSPLPQPGRGTQQHPTQPGTQPRQLNPLPGR